MTAHDVIPQRPDHADHAAPATSPDPAAVARYAAALLPAVLWLLGMYVFDGGVPLQLQGAIALAVTGLCTLVVRWAGRA
jgi:hypothetical protein